MKIAVIRRNYDPQGGGAERYAAAIVNLMTARGHEITIFAQKSANVPDNVNVVKVPKSPLSLCKTASFASKAKRMVEKSSFDIVFALSRYLGADVYRQAEQLHAIWCPIAYSKLSIWNPRHHGILKLERQLFSAENTGHVITNSEMVKSQIHALFGYPSRQINVIRNGVDRKKFYPASTEERLETREKLGIQFNHFALIFVAGNFKIKGLRQAIETISKLRGDLRERTRLFVIGGDDKDEFEKLAWEYGVSSQIVFTGKKSNMRDYYIAGDLMFYPSLYEPFANVCLEACACELPVLTTRLNGSSEVVKEGVTGYVVDDAECISEMKCAITHFAMQANQESMRETALQNILDFTWDTHVDRLEELFEEIVRKRND